MTRFFRKLTPSAECKCEFNFTCRYCLERAAERNLADYNAAPLTWINPPKKNLTNKQDSLS